MGSHIYHRFQGDGQALYKFFATPSSAIIRHFGIFVHFSAKSVTYQFAHDSISVILTEFLNGKTNVSHPVASFKLPNSDIERLFGYFKQLFYLGRNFSNFKGIGMIAVKSVFKRTAIYSYNIALL